MQISLINKRTPPCGCRTRTIICEGYTYDRMIVIHMIVSMILSLALATISIGGVSSK